MESLIFTCLCHTATHLRNVGLNPLKLFPVFFASHDERDQVFLHGVQKLFQETAMCKALFLIHLKHPQIPPPESQPLSQSQQSFIHTSGWERKFLLQQVLKEVAEEELCGYICQSTENQFPSRDTATKSASFCPWRGWTGHNRSKLSSSYHGTFCSCILGTEYASTRA